MTTNQPELKNPREYLEYLCSAVPHEPTAKGMTLKQGLGEFERMLAGQDPETRDDFRAYGVSDVITPRWQLLSILQNMAMYHGPSWDGPQAVADAVRLQNGLITPVELSAPRVAAAWAFPLVVRTYSQLLLPHVAVCRPVDVPTKAKKVPAWYLQVGRELQERRDAGDRSSSLISLRIAKSYLPLVTRSLFASHSPEELEGRYFTPREVQQELIANVAREVAFELNLEALNQLLASARGVEETTVWHAAAKDRVRHRFEAAANGLFTGCHGHFTHLFAGPAAWLKLVDAGLLRALSNPPPNAEQILGLSETAFTIDSHPAATYLVNLWGKTDLNTLLLVRARPHVLEAPLAYCPHRFEVTEHPAGHRFASIAALDVVEPALAVRAELDWK